MFYVGTLLPSLILSGGGIGTGAGVGLFSEGGGVNCVTTSLRVVSGVLNSYTDMRRLVGNVLTSSLSPNLYLVMISVRKMLLGYLVTSYLETIYMVPWMMNVDGMMRLATSLSTSRIVDIAPTSIFVVKLTEDPPHQTGTAMPPPGGAG